MAQQSHAGTPIPPHASHIRGWHPLEGDITATHLQGATFPVYSGQNPYFDPARSAAQDYSPFSTPDTAEQANYGTFPAHLAHTQMLPPPLWSQQQPQRSTTSPNPFTDPSEHSPPSPWFTTAVKDEEATCNVNANAEVPSPPFSVLKTATSSSMSIASDRTPSPPTTSIPLAHRSRNGFLNQQELYQLLRDICTKAAAAYWRSQHHAARSYSPMNTFRDYRRFDPYARHSHVSMPHDRRDFQQDSLLSLMDYIFRIADGMWQRAKNVGPEAERLELVRRMGNLFSWGGKVMAAAERPIVELDVRSGGVWDVVMAARDLTGWFLCEDGKGEIDRLCRDIWGV